MNDSFGSMSSTTPLKTICIRGDLVVVTCMTDCIPCPTPLAGHVNFEGVETVSKLAFSLIARRTREFAPY